MKRETMPRVAVVGGYGVGLTFVTDRHPDAGETVFARSFSTGHGGKGSNQAIAASRLGASVALLTAVGDDDFGQAASALWRSEGVDASAVRAVPGRTMAGAIIVDGGGENRIIIASGVLDRLEVADVDRFEPWIAAADVVLVSLEIPLPVAERACAFGKTHARTVILNPAPAATIPASMLQSVDYLVPNRLEAAWLTGSDPSAEPAALVASLVTMTDRTVVLTLGAAGVLIGGPGASLIHIPARTTSVVDTTGAGDAFNGAFAVAIAEGAGSEAAARFGALAGSHAVSIAEVIPSLPWRRDIGDPGSADASAGPAT